MDLVAQRMIEAAPAATVKVGRDELSLDAGKRLQIRFWSPGEVEALDVTVPTGKAWSVYVDVTIIEIDA